MISNATYALKESREESLLRSVMISDATNPFLLSLGLTSAVEGACSQGFLSGYLQAAPLLEFAYNIQQSISNVR